MARIEGYTEDDLDVLIAEFEPLVETSLRSVSQRVALHIEDRKAIVAASSAGLTPTDVAVASQYWQEEVDGVITPYLAQVYTGSAVHVAIGLGNAFPDAELPGIPLVADEFAVTYMKTVQNRLSGVGNEVWEDIRNELVDGINEGMSVEQIAARISNVANFEEVRARRIARTEVHAAAESGSHAQMTFMGYDKGTVTKEWVATRDARTRLTHSLADGQQVELDEPFTVGGSTLQFPGDPLGAPGEIINCRCTTIFEIDEEPKFRCDSALTAATAGSSGFCVIPTPQADISGIAETLREALFTAFMAAKISPAFGGAKIHKVLAQVRQDVGNVDHLTDFQILQVVDHKYTGSAKGTFLGKYTEWLQTPAGQKATGGLPVPKQATHVVAPTSIDLSTPIAAPAPLPAAFPPLPAVLPKPHAGDLKFTGKTLGSHGAQVWTNPVTGEKWLFKPIQGNSYSSKFLIDIDIFSSRLASKALMQRPGIYEFDLGGYHGTIQSMFDSVDAFPNGSFDPLKLSAEDILVMQREQIFDWLISNHDTHSAQWIRLGDGTLVGIDKGQAFKFFPKDKLDWDYIPVYPLQPDKLTYSAMWKAFVAGKKIDLQDPTKGPLGAYLDQLTAIPDAEYRALLRPYAESRVAAFGGDVEKFLDQAVARKNSLRTDFEAFWARAVKARQATGAPTPAATPIAKSTPVPTPQPAPPVIPSTPMPATSVTTSTFGDIISVPLTTKKLILAKWVELGGGKKVTPAWGGSKIWKMLQDLKAAPYTDPSLSDITTLDHLQILRILDEQGGFSGKPKTYESVLVDWLQSPAGKKAVPTVPTSLSKAILKPSLPDTAPKPVPTTKAPSVIPGKYAGDELSAGEMSYWFDNVSTPGEVGATWYDELLGANFRVILLEDTNPPPGSIGVQYKIFVQEYDPGTSHWVTQEEVTKYSQITKFKLKAVAKEPTGVVPVTPLAQPTTTPVTQITINQIKLSIEFKAKWQGGGVPLQPNDVVAVAKSADGLYDYRIIHKPATPSGYVVQTKWHADKNWDNTAADLDDTWVQGVTWTPPPTGMNAPPLPVTPSKIVGKMPGDVVSPDEIKLGAYLFDENDVIATATDPFTNAQWRVLSNGKGGFKFEIKPVGNDWIPTAAMTTPESQYTWHLTGDVLIDKTKSLLPGKNVGDSLTTDDIWDLAWGNVSQGDVFAYGWEDLTGTMYRLRIQSAADGGDMEAQWLGPDGKWHNASIVYDKQDLSVGNVKWHTAHPTKQSEIPEQLKIFVEPPPPSSPPPPVKAPLHQTKKTVPKKAPTKVAVSKTPLTGTSTHIPGVSVGDKVTKEQIMQHAPEYMDGEIVAQYTTGGWNKTAYRLVWTDDGLVKQKQLASGAWKSEEVMDADWKFYGQWEAANGFATKAQTTAMKKFIAKKGGAAPPAKKAAKVTPSYGGGTTTSYPTLSQGQLTHVDLSPWNATEQAEIVDYLAGLNPNSSPELVWGKLQQAKSHFNTKYKGKYLGLNELEMLRMLDAANAAKAGKVDLHLIEAKIVNWLQTPQGKFYVNRRIDAPIMATDVPVPMSALADFPDPNTQQYKVISTSEAIQYRQESHARYGGWKPGEKEALKTYTGGSYTSWNEAIRRGDLGSYKSKIHKAQQGMRPSTRPILLHRGTSFAEFNDPSITSYETLLPYVGRTYVNRGYNSTSVGGNAAFSGQLLIEYEAPAGTPMAYVADFSHHPNEREMLLPTHMTYEILSVTKKSSTTTVMRVRILGPATP